MNEGKFSFEAQGKDWTHLTRMEQWKVAWSIGPHELWETLRLIHLSAFTLSLLLVGLTIVVGVLRWRMILEAQGLHLSFVRATEISFVAQFFNSFFLGSTGGDLMKAYYAARETHHKKTEAVVTVFIDRLLGLWSMLMFGALMILPNLALFTDVAATKDSQNAVAALRMAAIIILGMLFACSLFLVLALWGGVSSRWPNARAFLRKLPKGEHLERSLDSCRVFGQQRALLLKSIVLSMLLNAICVVQVIVLAKGLDLHIPPLALFVIVPMITCISALPITPSGLGVREGLFVSILALPQIAVGKTAALSVSLLTFSGGLFWSVVGGLVYFFLRDRQHLNEITEEPSESDES
ncbi:MAG: hypothetical protein JWM68_1213 [Verrucomicrobiales bacterium]|nr:hypothetical protein [Verrucomicrobiales bacterium]